MIFSVHEYELAADATVADLRAAFDEARERGLFEAIPGLVEHYVGCGIRGDKTSDASAVWVYEDRASWKRNWGPVGESVPKSEYPEAWLTWEDELLDPVLAGDPDAIAYTAYESLGSGGQ